MAHWSADDISRELERRLDGKYGAERDGEMIALMVDVQFGSPPRFDPIAWAREVSYKPGWQIQCVSDLADRAYLVRVADAEGRRNQAVVPDFTVERSWAEAEAEFQRAVRLTVEALERESIDENLRFP